MKPQPIEIFASTDGQTQVQVRFEHETKELEEKSTTEDFSVVRQKQTIIHLIMNMLAKKDQQP